MYISALYWCVLIVSRLSVQEVSGEVFSYDGSWDLVVLKSAGDTPQQNNLRMIRTEFIAVS